MKFIHRVLALPEPQYLLLLTESNVFTHAQIALHLLQLDEAICDDLEWIPAVVDVLRQTAINRSDRQREAYRLAARINKALKRRIHKR